MDIINHNSIAWDKVLGTNLEAWSKPVSPEIIAEARNGMAKVLLTNSKAVPDE